MTNSMTEIPEVGIQLPVVGALHLYEKIQVYVQVRGNTLLSHPTSSEAQWFYLRNDYKLCMGFRIIFSSTERPWKTHTHTHSHTLSLSLSLSDTQPTESEPMATSPSGVSYHYHRCFPRQKYLALRVADSLHQT